MKSRLLSQLDVAIADAASHPVKADCLRIERVCLLARQGQIEEARSIHATLHTHYAKLGLPAVSAWLCLAEGLMCYFSDMNCSSRDKMRRAYALSAAARDARLHALSAAWLAQMDYVEGDFESMARHVAEAFQCADADHYSARARACLIAAQAYHFGGRFDLAQPWYAKSRQLATTEGDETMLSAIMHNMAGLMTHEARRVSLTGVLEPDAMHRAMMGIDSAGNFDALVGTGSLNALVPLLRAQVYTLQERWADAVGLYELHFADGLAQGLDRMRACLGADLAWARLQLGQVEQAARDASAADAAVADDRDADDRASAHTRLAQVYAKLGQADIAAGHAKQATIYWRAHESAQVAVVAMTDKALSTITA